MNLTQLRELLAIRDGGPYRTMDPSEALDFTRTLLRIARTADAYGLLNAAGEFRKPDKFRPMGEQKFVDVVTLDYGERPDDGDTTTLEPHFRIEPQVFRWECIHDDGEVRKHDLVLEMKEHA